MSHVTLLNCKMLSFTCNEFKNFFYTSLDAIIFKFDKQREDVWSLIRALTEADIW